MVIDSVGIAQNNSKIASSLLIRRKKCDMSLVHISPNTCRGVRPWLSQSVSNCRSGSSPLLALPSMRWHTVADTLLLECS
ncbi:hypothetical protein CY34DRAFT_630232 [Suillus luteus UH-Slu-Lm8-n1]|uniref:Uncharacterized protein n=1 Tax=Suillus luteus UH-Slu-Lm8-n1 TaxID=930992 RepID=A0A0D0C128_9AGAM|nr:hypothetical protein CY34DRAFT_630232 [Suillus luteus UH-Slu-Lm8-n1]